MHASAVLLEIPRQEDFTVMFNRPLNTQLTTEFFADMMGPDVKPKDVFLAFTVDQGGNVVNACILLEVEVIKCNAHRLNSATI